MKKRLLAMLMTGAMVASLAACGGNTNNNSTEEPNGESGSEGYSIDACFMPREPYCSDA